MRIALHHQPLRLGTYLIAAELSPRDEELLFRRKSIDGRLRRFAFARELIRKERDLRSRQVADTFAQNQLPIVMDARLDVVLIELVRDALRFRLEVGQVGVSPPVLQAAARVI